MIKFGHPCTILISGPTGCGKTQFVVNVVKQKLIEPFPRRIIYSYSEWQPAYDTLTDIDNKIEFTKGMPNEIFDGISKDTTNLLILDDQMGKAGKDGRVTDLFTKGSHHRNLTVIYLVQNLYDKGSEMCTISRNSQYMVIFKTPRDNTLIRTLSQQIFPKKSSFLVDAFNDATKSPYGYLVIDLKTTTPSELRYYTNVFDQSGPTIYVPKD